MDAENIYNIFEEEIIPDFYNRNKKGIPEKWVSYIKNTIALISPEFTMKRMLDDYYKQFYNKLISSSSILFANEDENIRTLTSWKRRMIRSWDSIESLSV